MHSIKNGLIAAALVFSVGVSAGEPTGSKNNGATEKPAAEAKATKEQSIKTTEVVLETSLGRVLIELYPDQAPISVKNFLTYVDDGFYDGLIFHRVVPNFVVQVGGFDANYQRKPTRAAIKNESDNGLLNLRGTLSMARTMSPDSATSQFFISLRDNPHLDSRHGGPGYAVFGKVIDGMSVIDKLPELPQGNHPGVFMNAPNEPVLIKKAYRANQKPVEETKKANLAPIQK